VTGPERPSTDDDAREQPVLVEQTIDDTDVGWGESWADDVSHEHRGRSDEEYLRDRPPHWE
jgi:hypothetical protein